MGEHGRVKDVSCLGSHRRVVHEDTRSRQRRQGIGYAGMQAININFRAWHRRGFRELRKRRAELLNGRLARRGLATRPAPPHARHSSGSPPGRSALASGSRAGVVPGGRANSAARWVSRVRAARAGLSGRPGRGGRAISRRSICLPGARACEPNDDGVCIRASSPDADAGTSWAAEGVAGADPCAGRCSSALGTLIFTFARAAARRLVNFRASAWTLTTAAQLLSDPP